MTRADRVVIAVLALMALAAWPLATAVAGGSGGRVEITGPRGESVESLDVDARYAVEGTLGEVTVSVSDGAVAVIDSGCPDHTCVRTGAVSAAGSVVACVPNRVVVRVGGAAAGELDARIR